MRGPHGNPSQSVLARLPAPPLTLRPQLATPGRPSGDPFVPADHRPPPTTPPGGGTHRDGPLPGRGQLILIVDDDENLRNALARMLKSLGFAALTAANGVEALAVIENSSAAIDALLVDVVMPQLGGPELVERLASVGIHPAVLYMTGYDDPAHLARVPESPPTPLLKKPFTLHALVLVLRDILDRPPL